MLLGNNLQLLFVCCVKTAQFNKTVIRTQRDGNSQIHVSRISVNRLTPNDPYMGRTAPLTSKRCILYIYSTNIGTEYFKHALYSPFFLFKMQFVS